MQIRRTRLISLLLLIIVTCTYFFWTTSNNPTSPSPPPWVPQHANLPTQPTPHAALPPIATIIHQTYKSNNPTDWAKETGANDRTVWFESWENQNKAWTHSILDDHAAEAFMRAHFDESVVMAYLKMPLPVLKADMLRYAMLYIQGGVYADSDTLCLKSVDDWYGEYKNATLIVSVEWYKDSHDFNIPMYKKTQLVQWTFAAAAGHPALLHTITSIAQTVNHKSLKFLSDSKNVESIGGPQVFTRFIAEYMTSMGDDLESLSKKDDARGRMYFDKSRVLVLPMFAFMAQLSPLRSAKDTSAILLMEHHFAGTYLDNGWKNN
ncbi:membrane-bound alpha-1,6- mannosyltransferase Initiation-specific [Podochytrium sp. JEL0797]|nr:membrane-bound alpha-1,6- mannosyltransferase Initiation-specific [Podochytrium sp. JEL0797]